jgi:nucleoside-diphosphate-sugar epimerase
MNLHADSKVHVEQDINGASARLRFDVVLNNLTAWAYAQRRVYIKSDGTPWRLLIHVEDISRGLLAALAAPREVVHNHALNVGHPEEKYRIWELAEIVRDVVPGSRIEYATDREPDPRCDRMNFGKIARLLPEFKPQWNARRGVEEPYAAYRRAGPVIEHCEEPRFKLIDHIKHFLATGRVDETLRWRTP